MTAKNVYNLDTAYWLPKLCFLVMNKLVVNFVLVEIVELNFIFYVFKTNMVDSFVSLLG